MPTTVVFCGIIAALFLLALGVDQSSPVSNGVEQTNKTRGNSTSENNSLGDVSENNSLGDVSYVDNFPSTDNSWRVSAIRNVFIILLIVLVVLLAVLGFRYIRSMKRQTSSKGPVYNKLNTSIPGESDEYEMSIYEKK